MALCVDISGTSINAVSGQTELTCTTYLLQTVSEVRAAQSALTSISFDTIGINPSDILYVFTWGMGVVLFYWSLGYAIGVARQLIRQL